MIKFKKPSLSAYNEVNRLRYQSDFVTGALANPGKDTIIKLDLDWIAGDNFFFIEKNWCKTLASFIKIKLIFLFLLCYYRKTNH